ncbi:hypothetical protein AB0M25_08385 [Streptomyces griseomycini]|uniref:hypothetical protein n=1 Tax=Streptomyces griseomycini TaxID=66895 RepID=UPI00341C4C9F
MAAVDADVVDGDDRGPDLSGNHPLRFGEPCGVVGASLGVGEDEGGGVRAPAGASGPLDVVGGEGGMLRRTTACKFAHVDAEFV